MKTSRTAHVMATDGIESREKQSWSSAGMASSKTMTEMTSVNMKSRMMQQHVTESRNRISLARLSDSEAGRRR